MSRYHFQPLADHGGFGEFNGFSFRHYISKGGNRFCRGRSRCTRKRHAHAKKQIITRARWSSTLGHIKSRISRIADEIRLRVTTPRYYRIIQTINGCPVCWPITNKSSIANGPLIDGVANRTSGYDQKRHHQHPPRPPIYRIHISPSKPTLEIDSAHNVGFTLHDLLWRVGGRKFSGFEYGLRTGCSGAMTNLTRGNGLRLGPLEPRGGPGNHLHQAPRCLVRGGHARSDAWAGVG